jgi:hypothetical protein
MVASTPVTSDATIGPFQGVSDINEIQDADSKYRSGAIVDCSGLVIKQPNPLGFQNGDVVTAHVIPSVWCEKGGPE